MILLKYWKLILGSLIIIGVFSFGYKVANLECEYEKKKEMEAVIKQNEELQKIEENKAIEFEIRNTELSKLNRDLNYRLKNETNSNYDCAIPASGLQLVNQAVKAANAS